MAYQAIHTAYYGPTNFRPARVKAWAAVGKRFYSWDHALGIDANHNAAAEAFAKEFGWQGEWVAGASSDGAGNVYVNLTGALQDRFVVPFALKGLPPHLDNPTQEKDQ